MTGFGRTILRLGSVARIAVASTSASASIPNGGKNRRYLLTTSTACYVIWGSGAQTASSTANTGFKLHMPAGQSMVVDIGSGNDTIAAIRESADGVFTIAEIIAD